MTGEIGQAELVGAGERRVARYQHPDRLGHPGAADEAGELRRLLQQPHVQRPVGQQPELLGGGQLAQVQPYAGAVLSEGPDDGGEHLTRHVRRYPDAQLAQLAPVGAGHHGAHPVGPVQQRAGLGQQHAAGDGEPDAAAVAVEQPGAELVLQPADALAQRRLRHPEPFRGPAEVTFLRHHPEQRQRFQQVHAATISAAISPNPVAGLGQPRR
nr:hypothetical protein [Actinocatenispora thailandica]